MPTCIVHEFPNETWVENIAVRANGKLLVSLISTPDIWQIDPLRNTAKRIHRFPSATSATSLVETEPDIFAVAIGNWSRRTFESAPGSWSIWKIDMRAESRVEVSKVTDIPEANFIDGMTNLPTLHQTVLVGDAGLGVVYRVDVEAGKYHPVISDEPALRPNVSAVSVLGVNGIHYREGYLYFVNSFKRPWFGRIPLTSLAGPAGPAQVIAEDADYTTNVGAYADDFALDDEGNAWIATDPSNELVKVTVADGRQTVVAGGAKQSILAGRYFCSVWPDEG